MADEEAAHSAKQGIWGGRFQMPADWRKQRKIEQLQQSLDKSTPQPGTTAPVRPPARAPTFAGMSLREHSNSSGRQRLKHG